MAKIFLSVIIPCYNEKENISRGVLKKVAEYLKTQKYPWQVIISDDASTDGSVRLIEQFINKNPGFSLLENAHGGKPFVLKAGLGKAKGEIILFTDMDQSTPISELDKLLPYFNQGYEVVIGSRGQARKGSSLFRRLASNIFRLIRQALLLKEIIDTQCGFKAFKQEAVKRMFSQMEMFKDIRKAQGWRVSAYDVEALFLAKKLGYRIKEVPVNWSDEDISVGKKRNFVKESKEMFREIIRVRLNDLSHKYR
jgi:dolichyl-phosphate beta-glucosyltransferase